MRPRHQNFLPRGICLEDYITGRNSNGGHSSNSRLRSTETAATIGVVALAERYVTRPSHVCDAVTVCVVRSLSLTARGP